jgi:hypothetical protein
MATFNDWVGEKGRKALGERYRRNGSRSEHQLFSRPGSSHDPSECQQSSCCAAGNGRNHCIPVPSRGRGSRCCRAFGGATAKKRAVVVISGARGRRAFLKGSYLFGASGRRRHTWHGRSTGNVILGPGPQRPASRSLTRAQKADSASGPNGSSRTLTPTTAPVGSHSNRSPIPLSAARRERKQAREQHP